MGNMAYSTLILLRMAMAVIDYPSDKIPGWTLPELKGPVKEFVMRCISVSRSSAVHVCVESEQNMRVPIQLAFYVRDEIFTINDHTTAEIGGWHLGKLFGSLDSFMAGYYEMRKAQTTPFP